MPTDTTPPTPPTTMLDAPIVLRVSADSTEDQVVQDIWAQIVRWGFDFNRDEWFGLSWNALCDSVNPDNAPIVSKARTVKIRRMGDLMRIGPNKADRECDAQYLGRFRTTPEPTWLLPVPGADPEAFDEFLEGVASTALRKRLWARRTVEARWGWFFFSTVIGYHGPWLARSEDSPRKPWGMVVSPEIDGERDGDPVFVDANRLRQAFDRLVTGPVDGLSETYRSALLGAYCTFDANGVVDADMADVIMQLAVLGEIRYS